MDTAIMFLVESIAISGVLYLLYLALFRGKASYVAQRVLLLSIPVVATLLAVVSIDLIPVSNVDSGVSVYLRKSVSVEGVEVDSRRVEINPLDFKIIRGDMDTEVSQIPIERSATSIWDYLPMSIWALVSLVLILLFVVKLSRILQLRRVAEKVRMEDYTVYNLECEDVVFSFWRGVYVSRIIEGEKLDFIMCHELAHIRHRHYIDKLIVELYMLLMWFNPIVRLIQREISLVHEYEADHAVVTSGCDVTAYKHFIFDVVATPVPTFSNGINSSQIKKRFIMMKSDYKVSHRVLRAFVTTATFIFVVMASLVYVQADTTAPKEDSLTISRSVDFGVRIADDMVTFSNIDSMDFKKYSSGTTGYSLGNIKKLTGLDRSEATMGEMVAALFQKVYLPQFVKTRKFKSNPGSNLRIELTSDNDIVMQEVGSSMVTTFRLNELWDVFDFNKEEFNAFTSQFAATLLFYEEDAAKSPLGDKMVNAHIKWLDDSAVVTVTSYYRSDPTNKTTSQQTYKINDLVQAMGRYIDIVPLEDLKERILGMVDYLDGDLDAMTSAIREANLPEIIIKAQAAEEERKRLAAERKAKIENVHLYPDDCQWVVFDNPDEYKGMYYTFVIRHKKYTQVDYVVNVRWNWHWINFYSVSYLLDKESGDKYMLHSILGDYPADKTLVFREQQGKTTVITRIYPPLDKDVEVVDLVEVDNPDVVFPENAMLDDPYNRNLKVYNSVKDLPYRLVSTKADAKKISLDEDFTLPKSDSQLYR